MNAGSLLPVLCFSLLACGGNGPPATNAGGERSEPVVSLPTATSPSQPASTTKETSGSASSKPASQDLTSTTGASSLGAVSSPPAEDPDVLQLVTGEKAIVAGTLRAEKYGGNAEYVLYLHGRATLRRKASDALGNPIGRLILRGNTGPLDAKRDQNVVVEIKNVQYDMNSSSGIYAFCEVIKLAKIVR